MTDNNSKPSRVWLLSGCAGILVFILCLVALVLTGRNLSVFIEPHERGIVVLLNEPTGEILEPGYHFVSPNKRVIIFNIGHQTYVMSAASTPEPDSIEGKTSDCQSFRTDISVVYAIDPDHLVELYKTWQDRYRDSVVRPMSRGLTRDTLGQYTINEILEKQDEIEKVIFNQLEASLAENYLILVEYDILDIRQISQ